MWGALDGVQVDRLKVRVESVHLTAGNVEALGRHVEFRCPYGVCREDGGCKQQRSSWNWGSGRVVWVTNVAKLTSRCS